MDQVLCFELMQCASVWKKGGGVGEKRKVGGWEKRE